ncbi:MAG TPA: hypothetical protein DCR55_16135 [Lentisphaeria bacterium]|nr:hypothetical protein [Lentisphaeria bacterium]
MGVLGWILGVVALIAAASVGLTDGRSLDQVRLEERSKSDAASAKYAKQLVDLKARIADANEQLAEEQALLAADKSDVTEAATSKTSLIQAVESVSSEIEKLAEARVDTRNTVITHVTDITEIKKALAKTEAELKELKAALPALRPR